MKKFKRFLFLFLLISFSNFFIQSCAISAIPTEELLFRDHYKDGLIIGSITFPTERARFNNYHFQLYSLDNKQNTRHFNIAPQQLVKMKHNGELDNGLTYLFAIRVPVGSYELNKISFIANGVFVSSIGVANTSFPFISEKGKITYFGNLFIDEYASNKEILIIQTYQGIRDLEKFKSLYPNIEWDNPNMYSNLEVIFNSEN